jgi:hypothetical protein
MLVLKQRVKVYLDMEICGSVKKPVIIVGV